MGLAQARPNKHKKNNFCTAYTLRFSTIFERKKLSTLKSFYHIILENATALGSWIPPHAVLLHVNNTPVKLKIIFAI